MGPSSLQYICTWIARLAWLQVIWVFLCLLGGGLFGVAPASVVICSLIRNYLNGYEKVTFRSAWKEYQNVFKRANKAIWAVVLPLFSVSWYVCWVVIHSSNYYATFSLALLPLIIMGLALTLSIIIYISIYQDFSFKQDVYGGLKLFITEVDIVMISFLAGIFMTVIAVFMPIVILIFGIIPVFQAYIGLLWYRKEELNETSKY